MVANLAIFASPTEFKLSQFFVIGTQQALSVSTIAAT
jgi:hypothetical protein